RPISPASAPEQIDGIISRQFPNRLGPLLIRPGKSERLPGNLLLNDRFKSRLVQLLEAHLKFHVRHAGGGGEDSNAQLFAHGCIRIASSIASCGQPMSATVT